MKTVRKWIHETILLKNFWCANFMFHCYKSYLPTYIAVVRTTTSYVYTMKKCQILAVILISFTPCESVVVMCFQKPDFFRNFNPRIYLRLLLKRWFQFISNIFHTVVLSIYCLNVVWRKGIFWILLFRKFEPPFHFLLQSL